MSNHYHLLIQTPDANLVEGMKWLQSTFANRFKRYRACARTRICSPSCTKGTRSTIFALSRSVRAAISQC
jgi:hypothetical protein